MEARDGLRFAICRAAQEGLLMVRMFVFTYSLYVCLVRETDGCIVFNCLQLSSTRIFKFISDFPVHLRNMWLIRRKVSSGCWYCDGPRVQYQTQAHIDVSRQGTDVGLGAEHRGGGQATCPEVLVRGRLDLARILSFVS